MYLGQLREQEQQQHLIHSYLAKYEFQERMDELLRMEITYRQSDEH